MAASMLNSYRPTQRQDQSLEECIRTALELGELSSALKTRISDLSEAGLTDREQVLLQILQDAIQDGCIQDRA
jgi:hypothetical protein